MKNPTYNPWGDRITYIALHATDKIDAYCRQVYEYIEVKIASDFGEEVAVHPEGIDNEDAFLVRRDSLFTMPHAIQMNKHYREELGDDWSLDTRLYCTYCRIWDDNDSRLVNLFQKLFPVIIDKVELDQFETANDL